jgi:superfamily II DNA or RNA helicase
MGKPTLKIIDAVHTKANKDARELIKGALAYRSVDWKRNRKTGRRDQVISKRHLITGRTGTAGTFLTGLVPRVKKYARKRGYRLYVVDESEKIKPTAEPNIKGITFRPDQIKALRAVKRRHRGKIVFPTGSGKTIIAAGIISMYPELRFLFLCHTKDLLRQSFTTLKKMFPNVYALGGGYRAKWDRVYKAKNPILIAIDKSYYNFMSENENEGSTFFDGLLVDEVHHVNAKDSQYGQILERNLAPIRIGLTATIPTKKRQILINEGYFGPTIAELSVEEGIDLGIIAKPQMNIVPVPYDVKLNKKCKGRYKRFYDYAIVKNRVRNKLICDEVIKTINNNETILVIIERKIHGKTIQKMLKYKGMKVPFIYGSTDNEIRHKTLRKIKSRKTKAVICSRVWKEGINIPSLNHIVNAVGMKEEKAVLQAAGRGLRTTEEKKTIKITDFLDPYKYLAEHSVLRMSIYIKKGWLK